MSDLSITALYTSATWAWGKLPGAELLASPEGRRVFDATNAALGLMALGRPDMPSLRHALIQRHVMIDALLAEMRPTHVLELAAGLSRRGLTVSADPKLAYVEVDRAPLFTRKRELLARTPEGQAALARTNWRLVVADLADPGFDLATLGTPQLVIAEGLFMYLPAAAQQSLWKRIHALLASGGTFVFDLVPFVEQRKPGAIGRALEWTMKRFTGGAGFERDARTRDQIAQELEAIGFTVEKIEPRSAPPGWRVPHLDVTTQQLLFVCRT